MVWTESPSSDLQTCSESLSAIVSGGSPGTGRTQGPGKIVRVHRRSSRVSLLGRTWNLRHGPGPCSAHGCTSSYRRFSTTTRRGMVSSFSLIRRLGPRLECMHVRVFGGDIRIRSYACTCIRLFTWIAYSRYISYSCSFLHSAEIVADPGVWAWAVALALRCMWRRTAALGGRVTATSTAPRGPPAWKKRSFHDFQLGGLADTA